MKNLTWIIQSNVSHEHDKWFMALKKMDSPYRAIKIIPFSEGLDDVQYDTPYAVVHGTTTLIKNAHKKLWNPGAFFNPDNFRPSLWKEKYGEDFVNHAGFLCKLKDADVSKIGDYCFIRPDGDLKDFSGSLVSKDGLKKFIDEVNVGGCAFDENLDVFLAPELDIVHEWRCFVVNGKVVAASKYKLRTMLDKKEGAPQEVIEFANIMAEKWSPEKAFVMDICETAYDTFKILELNCFNASGVYLAPIEPIIEAVENIYK